MAKKFLSETISTVLEYTEQSVTSPKGLGHLAGIGAEFNAPTRNGRRYPIELWRNVMASDDFKEGMETHTLFAETDHPQDRVDTSIKEVCAVLTNMEIRENEGILWVEFDILDTPQGRILKSLVDYGCKIGVSSRGLGDEIQKNGETIIDPETYSYYGHDMVVQPAVKSARPEAVEEKARAKVSDVFQREIESATSVTELVGLKRLAESVNMPNLDSIKESIDNKISSGSLNGNTISEQLENDLGNLAEENENLKSELESLKKANTISDKQIRKLTEDNKAEKTVARRTLRRQEVKNERLERVNRNLSEQLKEERLKVHRLEHTQNKKVEILENKVSEYNRANSKESKTIKMLEKRIHELEQTNNDLKTEIVNRDKQLERLTKTTRVSESRIVELEKLISQKENELDNLYEENNLLNDDLKKASNSQLVTESKIKNVSNKLNEQNTYVSEVLERYIGTKCLSEGIDQQKVRSMLPSNYTIEDVDMVVEKVSDEKRRLNKLPIAIKPISVESSSVSVSEEDKQTMRFLENFGRKIN